MEMIHVLELPPADCWRLAEASDTSSFLTLGLLAWRTHCQSVQPG
jgi:hypothetical protein